MSLKANHCVRALRYEMLLLISKYGDADSVVSRIAKSNVSDSIYTTPRRTIYHQKLPRTDMDSELVPLAHRRGSDNDTPYCSVVRTSGLIKAFVFVC